jgi:hypothetical protein
MTETRIGRLRIEVGSQPDPFLLRQAIETRLGGGAWPRPAEDEVAEKIRFAIEESALAGARPVEGA